MTTEEGNKIIAEFMGLKIEAFPDKSDEWLVDKKNFKSIYHNVPTQEIDFDSSWDWLMPAWDHFRYLVWEKHNGYPDEFIKYKESFLTAVFNGSIAQAWRVIVLAIKWHTKSPSKPL